MVPTICFVHESARSQVKSKVLRWDKGNIAGYYQLTGKLFFKIMHRLPCCIGEAMSDCNVVDRKVDVDVYYQEIAHCLKTAAKLCILSLLVETLKHYWSDVLDDIKQKSISRY